MIELTFEQEHWLKKLFVNYFPHVGLNIYPIEIFEKYLKFVENGQSLTLPQHLQCPYESKNHIPVIKMGLDVPAMVADVGGPFFSLIQNSEYLEGIKEKIKKEVFSIFGYLAQKKYDKEVTQENCRFLEKYNEMFSPLSVSVPELFFKELGNGNQVISAKYNGEKKCFIWEYTWDFSYPTPLLAHTPSVIVSDISTSHPGAFQYFARKVYTVLGSIEEVATTDYETLIIAFLKQIEKCNDFYRDALKEKKEWFLFLFKSMLHYELEGVGRNEEFGRSKMYIPAKFDSLTEKIKNKSNQKELEKYANEKLKLYIPKEYSTKAGDTKILKSFTKDEYNFVRDIYNKICECLEHDRLSEESRTRLQGVGKKNKNDQLWAINYLLSDSNSQDFLEFLIIQNVLKQRDILKLTDLYNKQNPIMIDKPFDEEDSHHEFIGDSKTKSPEGIALDKLLLKRIKQQIREKFPEPEDNQFVNDFITDLIMHFNRIRSDKLLIKDWTNYHLIGRTNENSLYKKYKGYRGIKSNCISSEKFREKIEEITGFIKVEYDGIQEDKK
jgi:hypothetical protein